MGVLSRRVPPVAAALGVLLAVLVAGCAQLVPGRASPMAAAPTVAVTAPDPDPDPGSGTDDLAASATVAIQDFWRAAFPAEFGREWTDIATFAPVRTDAADAAAPPCVESAADLADQAFYCPGADAVVWDADGLLPELRERFGPAGVVVVLAHEIGHAVQTRLGVDEAQVRDPSRFPTILLEAMADCYAGVVLAHLAEQPVAGLPMGPDDRDAAMLALVGFRDPLGVEPGDVSAHGNAFDRVSAFQDGYTEGAGRCAAMSLDNRVFTQRRFGSAADRVRGGDLPLPQLLVAVERDARGWFGTVVPGWVPPPIGDTSRCPADALQAQGPVRFCATDGAVSVDRAELEVLHRQLGDFAGATLVAGRYGLAAVGAAGAPTAGPAAGAAAVCLAGAYTGRLIDPDGDFSLSPGDLDEAIAVLLVDDWAARDDRGAVGVDQHGFDRIERFRTGLLTGQQACLPG